MSCPAHLSWSTGSHVHLYALLPGSMTPPRAVQYVCFLTTSEPMVAPPGAVMIAGATGAGGVA